MGCYDAVKGKCPACRNDVSLQSKSGDCDLEEYTENDVPVEVMYDATATCRFCGTELELAYTIKVLGCSIVEKNTVASMCITKGGNVVMRPIDTY